MPSTDDAKTFRPDVPQKRLPSIDAPDVAVAETMQQMSRKPVLPPRNVMKRLTPNIPSSFKAPHPTHAAKYFLEIYDGWICAQGLIVAEVATDLLKMWTSEKTELEASCTPNFKPVDGSLPPRKVAMWILGEYKDSPSRQIDLFLDAVSAWSQSRVDNHRTTTRLRMSAAFDADAKHALELSRRHGELVEHVVPLERGDVAIMLRWHDGTRIRAACTRVNTLSAGLDSLDGVAQRLQDAVVRLGVSFGVPLGAACMRPIPAERLIPDAYYFNHVAIRDEFFDMLVCAPSVNLCPETVRKNASRILRPTGCLVRLCNKSLGNEGLNVSSCFHGAVIGFANKKREWTHFLNQLDDRGALRVPTSADERELGLHMCAVQVEATQLNELVSVYGTCGIAGSPMHVPGSYVWIARPALRPLDPSLMNVFSLIPCDRESMLPSRKELVPGFERFWMHTTVLFNMVSEGSSEPEDVHQLQGYDRAPLDAQDEAMIRLMGIQMQSPRTTLGDAYAYLSPVHGLEAVCLNIKQAMASLGVRASLYDMFMLNQRSIEAYRSLDDSKRKSEENLMGLCDIALQLAYDGRRSKAQRVEQEPIKMSAEQIRRVLRSCALKAGTHCTLDAGFGSVDDYGDALQEIVTSSTWSDVVPAVNVDSLLRKPFAEIFKEECKLNKHVFVPRVESAIALSSAVSLVSVQCVNPMLFLITSRKPDDCLWVKKVEADGSVTPSTLQSLWSATNPKVIILQELDRHRLRVTATRSFDGK